MSAGRAPARAETDPAAASLLLTRTALGKDWDDLSASNGEVQPHQYCGAAFASDAAVRDRSYTELVRHTDGLRIEQEVLRYAGDQDAARALTEFRTALECGRYSSGTGANRLDIEALRSSWEPAGPQDGESGSVTFTKGDVVLHTRLAIYRDGRFLNVLSIALHDDGALEHESPALARLALRAARWA
jgi:hypothetical protein